MSFKTQEVLKRAKEFMARHAKASWSDYEHFKRLAGLPGAWLDDYDSFISSLAKILKL